MRTNERMNILKNFQKNFWHFQILVIFAIEIINTIAYVT